MRTTKKIILLICIVLLCSSCEKKYDYPRDIPRWLKKKIKEQDPYCVSTCWELLEYETQTGEMVYMFYLSDYINVSTIYDSEGKCLCEKVVHFDFDFDTCSYFVYSDLILKRRIWAQKAD